MEFLNEMADDYGGPRREFQRLLMMAIQGTLGVFEGRSNELFFTYDLRALEQQKFFKAGKLTAWSVAHGGPGPRSISRSVYLLMCHQSAPLSDLDIGVLLDEDKGGKLQQLKACRTEEDLQRLKVSCGEWVSDCGVPSFYTSTLQEMPQVIERVVANYCFHRVASMVQQYTAGLNSCGRFFDLVSANWQQFLPIFCSTGGKLTRQTFRGLFLTDWSPEGSNARGEEEETIFQYDDWLIKVEEGEVDATLEDLLVFVTGADHPPALGFPRKCEVHFFDQEPGTRRLPYASTCALFLYLPRGVREEEDFADMMSTSLVGSLGFGKV
ncbi:G2/M phase-specific E3 ubiquitin-protein ligase-like [Gadus chalcogrammus]|uniref:G2/M phase-specific E3 ubiquitin-protein ligase-like n=1 Tax=Gadus chalcogrammus TaxID=1042646 RepID=UPI0024C37A4D|nr:G2/M phase-specific E3 ubiquitin-protein ligase-like [Gadus chalcogrammus]